jgi:hypothetical protein
VFGVTALLPLLVSASALLVSEERIQPGERAVDHDTLAAAKQQGVRLWQAARQRSIWVPTVFVFLWQVKN